MEDKAVLITDKQEIAPLQREAGQIQLNAQFNIAYHSARHKFLENCVRLEKIMLLVSLTATIALVKELLKDSPLPYISVAIAAGLTILLIVGRAHEVSYEHRDLVRRWSKLYTDASEALARRAIREEEVDALRRHWNEIIIEEPPGRNMSLMIFSQNQVLREIGSPSRLEQKWWRRMFRNFFDGDADNLNPIRVRVDISSLNTPVAAA
ncbi:hypothetical protein [Variovorax sp. PCZ-1]|uniref:hypothetical protein n=1 Tax=Variovorax sp. PCZ-1 TaxID=2835533 RepID=UPI001BCBFD47|nr:hypothetical protein [Variovorax sp. PCZ-1]MBS7806142.1 hypothetical protein [Variovorax sp. PCZ-1]